MAADESCRNHAPDTQRRPAQPRDDASDADATPPVPRWSFGLGKYSWVGNASAMGVMIVALLYLGGAYIKQAEDERAFHRTEATAAHGAVTELVGTMRDLTAEVRALSDQVRADRQSTAQLTATVRTLVGEVAKLKERERAGPE